MKNILNHPFFGVMMMGVGALIIFVAGCDARPNSDHRHVTNNDVTESFGPPSEFHYIKDSKTGNCFAYYWGGTGNGGPALANIRCNTIPSELLNK